MFESGLAPEISAFLEMRKHSVSGRTLTVGTATMKSLDRFLTEQSYTVNELSEEILDEWARTLAGKSIKNAVLNVRLLKKSIFYEIHNAFMRFAGIILKKITTFSAVSLT